jgi:hypothetical protein
MLESELFDDSENDSIVEGSDYASEGDVEADLSFCFLKLFTKLLISFI